MTGSSKVAPPALAAALALPALVAAQGPRLPSPPASVELREETVELPMLRRGALPAVEVRIDGRGPYLFAIDTGGGGYLRVDAALAAELGLEPTGVAAAGDGTGRAAGTFPVVRVGELAVGALVVRGVEAMSRDYNTSAALPPIDGVLCVELFDGLLLTLDYPRSRVRIERASLPEPDGETVFAFRRRGEGAAGEEGAAAGPPVVALTVGGETVEADLDTGSMGGLLLPPELVARLQTVGEPRVVGRGRTVAGEFEISVVEVATPILLGGLEIDVPAVEFAPPFRRANLGSRWLSRFELTLDLANRRVRLRSPAGGPPEG